MSQIWGWGNNYFGQIGNNTAGSDYSSPVQNIDMSYDWKLVTGNKSSYARTYAIKNDGTAWAWGYNYDSYLGVATTGDVSSPVQVIGVETWKDLSAGAYHVVALNSNNTLWSWGDNSYGQLGTNNTTNQTSPVILSTGTDWSKVSCGFGFSAALKSDGSLWTWGDNDYGQIGNNTAVFNYSSPVQVAGNWSAFAAGYNHMGGIKTDGSLWMWGYNNQGQLGDNTTLDASSPVQVGLDTTWEYINCGETLAGAIKSDGSLWMWGNNSVGELGINDDTILCVSSPVQVIAATTWTMFANGNDHVVGLDTNNAVWTWGYNSYGQLGNNSTDTASSPIQILAGALNWSSVAVGDSNTFALQGFNTTSTTTTSTTTTSTTTTSTTTTSTTTTSTTTTTTSTTTTTPFPTTSTTSTTPSPNTYAIKLSNDLIRNYNIATGNNILTEGMVGSLDATLINGNSSQRSAYLTYANANGEVKVIEAKDGETVDFTMEKFGGNNVVDSV